MFVKNMIADILYNIAEHQNTISNKMEPFIATILFIVDDNSIK